jgi:hypothetical protein
MAMSAPTQAAVPMTGAEKLHRLDIMLKVAGDRCENTGDDLRPDYAAFVRNHRFALGQASRQIRGELARRHGASGADQAYERMNFALADEYRQRHPWLNCRELKVAAQGLAVVDGSATLLEAADQILPDGPLAHLASMRGE